MRKFHFTLISLFVSVGSLTPFISSAQLKATAPFIDVKDIQLGLLCVILNWMFTFAIIVSIISVLYGAWLYLTSAGNEEKVKQAHSTIIYAAIGVAVALIAGGLPLIIDSVLNAGLSGRIC